MEIKKTNTDPQQAVKPIAEEQLKTFTKVLLKYKAGLTNTKNRIISNENWWKLRNTREESKDSTIDESLTFKSVSSWLHNVVTSKHADAMEAYPEPNILPREAGDKAEAKMLTDILPCILEQNHFESTYSDNMWQKGKYGTSVYKVLWDKSKLNGLGDISIECVNLLDLYWQPGISDIQKSRYFFHTELVDKDLLKTRYPELEDKLDGKSFVSADFNYDDTVDTSDMAVVIDVYYRKNGILHYVKYVDDKVLFATENETQPITSESGEMIKPPMAETGLYDHGLYPYVFDALFPIEGSPCGYGYIDITRNPQTEIDLMKTAFVQNTMVGATPRYFAQDSAGVSETEFLNIRKPIVHCTGGSLDDNRLRPIDYKPIDGSYLNLLRTTIDELRETSGNTETATGTTSGGVTAASAIAALQEASGKGSRDSTLSAYRAYGKVIELCIELIRQFYDMPRKFRILGQYGTEQYITYTNANLQPKSQGSAFGQDMGFKKPVFDVKVSAQKKNIYTKISQNELAMQFFSMGFFNPQNTDQALMCLDLMEFEGKDALMLKISQNGTMFQKLAQYMQMSLMLAAETHPEMVAGISGDIQQMLGGGAPMQGGTMPSLGNEENAVVSKAREQSAKASQPN